MSDRDERIGPRTIAALFVVAVGLRVVVFAVVLARTHLSVGAYADKGDGQSYQRYASAILGDGSAMTDYDRRVFPGYPAAVAAVALVTRLPVAWAALGVTWASAGVAAAAAAALFRDRRVGWAMVLLIPHYPINSSLAMGEAPCLAATLGGLWLAFRERRGTSPGIESSESRFASRRVVATAALPDATADHVSENPSSIPRERGARHVSPAALLHDREPLRWLLCGLLLGLAISVRPVAAFAALGLGVAPSFNREWRALAWTATPAALVLLGGYAALHAAFGDALYGLKVYARSPRAYDGQIFTWPLRALIEVPLRTRVPFGEIVYVALHLGVVIAACAVAVGRVGRARRAAAAGATTPAGRDNARSERSDAAPPGRPIIPVAESGLSTSAGSLPRGNGTGARDRSINVVAAVWLVANTLFVLCIGSGHSGWGFYHFPRFTLPAEPAIFWTLRGALPRSVIVWIVVGGLMTAVGIAGVMATP